MTKKLSRGIGEKTYRENECPAFIAGEVGEVAIWLMLKDQEVSRAAMAEYLEKKRREVGNTIHKGVLRDAAKLVRDGKF
ncbi:hypothetical protein ACKAAE_001393 [Klebsiella pneumoniae]|nr:hypothetical protein [Klebsiella pneumoniae]